MDADKARYYEELEKHINSLSAKFREKNVIKQIPTMIFIVTQGKAIRYFFGKIYLLGKTTFYFNKNW